MACPEPEECGKQSREEPGKLGNLVKLVNLTTLATLAPRSDALSSRSEWSDATTDVGVAYPSIPAAAGVPVAGKRRAQRKFLDKRHAVERYAAERYAVESVRRVWPVRGLVVFFVILSVKLLVDILLETAMLDEHLARAGERQARLQAVEAALGDAESIPSAEAAVPYEVKFGWGRTLDSFHALDLDDEREDVDMSV